MGDYEIQEMIEALKDSTIAQMPKASGLTYGVVKSLNPLSILVDGFKEPLDAEFFFLGQMVRPHKVTIPHKHEYNGETELANDGGQGASSHKHSILKQVTEDLHVGTGGYKQDYVILDIYPPLAVSDRVLLFSFNDGQKYYVAERIEVGNE